MTSTPDTSALTDASTTGSRRRMCSSSTASRGATLTGSDNTVGCGHEGDLPAGQTFILRSEAPHTSTASFPQMHVSQLTACHPVFGMCAAAVDIRNALTLKKEQIEAARWELSC